MGLNVRSAVFGVLLMGLANCTTVPTSDGLQPLERLITRKDVIRVPYQTNADGLYMVPVSLNGSSPVNFILDTGATRSAIYRGTARQLGLSVDNIDLVTVHGMIESAELPSLYVDTLALGNSVHANMKLAVLKDENAVIGDFSRIKGIIGMDILSLHRIAIDADNSLLALIPKSAPLAVKPNSWKYVPLNSNPYLDDGRSLKYMSIRVQGRLSPALLDTGSTINLMNWEIAKDPYLRSFRRRMREQWTLQGAIGKFDPAVKVKFKNFRSGEKRWGAYDFIVKDIDSLDVLGISEKPFVIVGAGLLKDKSLYIDFDNNTLFLESDEADRRREAVTGSRVGSSSHNVTLVVPATRN